MLPTVATYHCAVAAEIGVGAIVDDFICVNSELIAIVEVYSRIIEEYVTERCSNSNIQVLRII